MKSEALLRSLSYHRVLRTCGAGLLALAMLAGETAYAQQNGRAGAAERAERFLRLSPAERLQAEARWRAMPMDQKVQARQEIREHITAMTPEERQQMRQQMREHWQQLPVDERRALREQRQIQREQWQAQREEWRATRDAAPENRPARGQAWGWRGR